MEKYVALLWEIMATTGKGYKKGSLRNSGKGEDRRADKLGTKKSKFFRSYAKRYDAPAVGNFGGHSGRRM